MNAQAGRGIEHFNAGRFAEALVCFRSAAASGDRDPQTRVLLAHALEAAGQPEKAAAAFVRAIKAFPGHEPAYAGLANLSLRRGLRPPRALRGALKLAPAEGGLQGLLATLRLCAKAWRARDAFVEARTALMRAQRLAPADAETRRSLVEVLEAQEQNFIAKMPKKAPNAALKRLLVEQRRRAKVALLRKRSLEAVAAREGAKAERGLIEALVRDPRDLTTRRQLRDILKQRYHAASRDPVEALRRKALLLASEGRFGRAESALRRALRLAPENKSVRALLSKTVVMRGWARPALRLEHAEQTLRRALAVRPADEGLRKRLIEVLRSQANDQLARGDLDAAERTLRRARSDDPESGRVRADLLTALTTRAQVLLSGGNRARAAKVVRRVLRLDPGNARIRLVHGQSLYISGRVEAGRALLRSGLRRAGGALTPAERFKTLMKLGRYREALRAAEKILDAGASLDDLRAFWDPWEWDERRSLKDHRAELKRLRAAVGSAPGPWLHYYSGSLKGPAALAHFDELARFPPRRYGWMYFRAGLMALAASDFRRAADWFERALLHKPADWRARCFLAEARLCLGDTERALTEMDRALKEASEKEAGQVLAWRGAFDLWLGRYDQALERLERAAAMSAQCAFCWKGAALLKLGRPGEALEALDLTLERYPLDLEALIWRGETKRVLGRHREALEDLARVPKALDLWARFNAALSKRALGDEAGMLEEFERIPAGIREHLRAKTGESDPAAILEAGLELSRGFRRAEYSQAVWLR